MGAGKRVRIADVAACAGVGIGTVSRVLNGSPHVSDATRKRVLDAIERTRYRPSRLAAGLSRGSPRSVGIIVPFLTRPSVVARLAGVIDVLDTQGYDTVVFNVETPAQRDRHAYLLTERHRAAGIVVLSLRLSPGQLLALAEAGLPVVLVDVAAPGLPCTVVDDVLGGLMATRHLLDLGHRRIGFVGDRADAGLGFRSTARRLRGYRQALAAAGVPIDPAVIRRGGHSPTAGAEMAARLLALPEPPSAIFAASDTQAAGVLTAAEAAGLAVPGELSVIGFDDIESAAQRGLSTIHQPLRASGAHGAQRLCQLLRGEAVIPLREVLPLKVMARRSTAAPPVTAAPRTPYPQRRSAHLGSHSAHPEENRTVNPEEGKAS